MTQQADRPFTDRVSPTPADDASRRKINLPVNIWAFVGALVVIAELYVLTQWVTGPYFERVPTGPSDPPTWMKASLLFWQIGSIPATLGLVFWFVVRPWRRDRHLGIDGLLVIAFCTMWFQDPISSFGGHWFTYNSWMLNRGSWVNDIPGWQSFGEPGAMLQEPILFTPFAYCYIFVIVMFLGSWFMRRLRQRFPAISNLGLIGSCFVLMMVFDLVLEGLIWMPMGIFGYHGGHLALFPETFHKFPLQEALSIGGTFTVAACLRFFVNDRGQSVFERGSEDVRGGAVRRTAVRALAAIAVVQLAFLVTYNVPNYFIGTHSTEWPRDVQERSYFTNGICGEGTGRICPGPAAPLTKNDNGNPGQGGSIYVDPSGRAVTPPGTTVPDVVPYDVP